MLEELTNTNPSAKVVDIKDIAKLNMFGIIRMLETAVINIFRIKNIWDFIAAHLESLSNSKFIQLRSLAVKAIACLIINVILSRKDNEKKDYQKEILLPLQNALLTNHNECVKGVIASLHEIIENCGPYIGFDGWEVILAIIDKISKSSGDNSERIEQAFKCIEMIAHHYLHKLDCATIPHILKVVHNFATLKLDVNISLVAVGLIQNFADQICLPGKLPLPSEEKQYELFLTVVNYITDLGRDERGELRIAAYRTLEAVIVDHAQDLTIKMWNHCLLEKYPQLIHYASVQFYSCKPDCSRNPILSASTIAQTPTFTSPGEYGKNAANRKPKQMKFDEETVIKVIFYYYIFFFTFL